MGRPANSRVPTKRAAQPKAPKENGTAGQPTKKKTGASGTRVTVGAPYVAADKPNVEGTPLTELDRAVLLPQALVPLPAIGLVPSPQAHDMRMRVPMYACPNAKTMRRCTLSCVSWQRQRELDLRRGPWQVQPHRMRSHTRALRTHTTHAWGHPSTRHAQPKYPCAPCH